MTDVEKAFLMIMDGNTKQDLYYATRLSLDKLDFVVEVYNKLLKEVSTTRFHE